ncbi:DUF3426 domain-containing protein [Stutzerimonas urumqiensis]|uniref:DUF3426 domain-containing protein n=1 Tax=Stutzerimonas urumqiensis TaxID=638269 RepID=UPI000EAEEAB6|nr:DUF3426 domain-containing protein [Stutzerimonas urumqiensis]
MTSFITQCPQCRTTFRVNPTQLGAANGIVRCGSCRKVFDAGLHLKTAADLAPTAGPLDADRSSSSPAVVAQRLAGEAPSFASADMELDLDHLDLDAELARLEHQEKRSSALRRRHGLVEPADSIDESWAERLLQSEQDEDHPAEPVKFSPAPGDAGFAPAPLTEPSLRERPPTPFTHRDEPSLGALRAEPEETTARREPDLRADPLFELEDDPLRLDWQPQPRRWGRRLGWMLAILLATLALVVQYVAYNFEALARQAEYRPWLERLCPSLGCELPPEIDIDAIKSSNLMVRSHPDFEGALTVDAILYNRAPFAQPFPALELRFADLNGKLLASRRFRPSEYLAGEMAGEAEMPPQTPIHISIEILDPGENAVNYSLSFHSPE